MSAPVAVVGAGPAGLFQALYLAKVRKRPVVIIEQQGAVGGILRGGDTPWGPVDQGAYIFQETGQRDLDGLFGDCMPEEAWHRLEGVRRDIGGNYFSGAVDEGSLFPDIRRLPAEDYRRCTAELAECAAREPPGTTASANLADYLSARFGPHVVKCVHAPFVRKFWRAAPEDLAAATAVMVHMTRVVAHDMEQSLALKRAPGWNAVLGVPDQLAFPPHLLSSTKACLYPRAYGTANVLGGLTAALRRSGVEILTGASITGLDIAQGAVRGLHVTTGTGARTVPVSGVLWASANGPLLAMLGLQVVAPMAPPVPHRIVNLFLDRPPLTGPLYWLWSYDPATQWIRFSSGAAYCPAAAVNGLYPVCVETNIPRADMPSDAVVAQVEQELRAGGLMAADTKVVGTYVHPGVKGFFVPNLANCASLAAQRTAIEANKPANLFATGQDIAAGVFFLPDVLLASLPALDIL